MIYKERIKFLREYDEIEQQAVAKAIGLERRVYSNYENGEYIMPTKHLNNVTNFLDVSFDYLFGFTDKFKYYKSKKEIDKIKAGQRLKEVRQELKLTQTQLAELLNTTHSVIAGYESGRRLIATPFLFTVCKNYNVSADYLLGKVDEPKYLK